MKKRENCTTMANTLPYSPRRSPFLSPPITTVNECQRVLIAWVWLVTLNAMFKCNEKENADMDLSKDDWPLQNSR
jgi:hypothetical protein